MSVNKQVVIQFAKAPELGRVKTRLQGALSEQECLNLHCQLVDHVANQILQLKGVELEFYLTKPKQQSLLGLFSQREKFSLNYQADGDLGERMSSAFSDCFVKYESSKIAIVGSDCPFFDDHYFAAVWSALDEFDVVIGPAKDGGYVLMAMKQHYKELFQGIDWGGNKVLEQTLLQVKKLGLSFLLMPELNDIDRPEDLKLLDSVLDRAPR